MGGKAARIRAGTAASARSHCRTLRLPSPLHLTRWAASTLHRLCHHAASHRPCSYLSTHTRFPAMQAASQPGTRRSRRSLPRGAGGFTAWHEAFASLGRPVKAMGGIDLTHDGLGVRAVHTQHITLGHGRLR